MKDVPYIVYESEMARLERVIRRQFVLVIVALIFLVGTNGCWLWYESQFEDVSTTVEQGVTADDYSDAIINDGVHINGGESIPESNDKKTGAEEGR